MKEKKYEKWYYINRFDPDVKWFWIAVGIGLLLFGAMLFIGISYMIYNL